EAYALSPDGKWVLAAIPKSSGSGWDLALLPTGAGKTRILETPGTTDFYGAAWLPGGSRVIFSGSSPTSRRRLYVTDVAGGKPRESGPEGAGIEEFSSPVSPDGRLVFGSRADKTVLFPLNGEGIVAGELILVPGLEAVDVPIQWSVDGRSLYVFRRGSPLRVFLVDWKTGE